jgi:hypothetical protein
VITVVLGGAVEVPGEGDGLLVGEGGEVLQPLPQGGHQPGHQRQAPQRNRQVPAYTARC